MSTDELALRQSPGALIPTVPSKYDDSFVEMSTAGKWLPRLQLFGSNTDAVKEDKIAQGNYGLVVSQDSIIPLGKEVNVLIAGWRPKALDVSGDTVVSCFNPHSALFKKLQADSAIQDSGCMYGPEFLVYVPDQKLWATFFMGSKTSRREAPNVKALIGMAATLKVNLISTAKYKWHGPVTTRCSTPFEIPPREEIVEQITTFNDPPEEIKEPIDPDSAGTTRDR